MRPSVFNVFKPVGMTSYQAISHFKRNLPGPFGKIGHFGTLDPFACGVLMVGISGAARLNDYVHKYMPKTYLAIGKLGVMTETGDLTVNPTLYDDAPYLTNTIAAFSKEFINDQLQRNFLGNYWQAPHTYSAAKYQGRKLCEWARDGVYIKKEKKLRHIYKIDVVKYSFPYLSIRVTVSSGTYVRTLFHDMAKFLGTYGALVGLLRESVGSVDYRQSLRKDSWPLKDNNDWSIDAHSMPLDEVFRASRVHLDNEQSRFYSNGNPVSFHREMVIEDNDEFAPNICWVYGSDNSLVGLGEIDQGMIKVKFNIPT